MKKNTKIIATLPLIVKEYTNNDMVLDLTYKTRPDFFPEWRLDNPIEDKNLSIYFHEIEENIGKKDFILIFPSINLLQILNDKKIKFNSIIPEKYMMNDYCGRLFNSHKIIPNLDLELIEDIMRNWNTILNTLHYYELKDSYSFRYDDSWLSPENYKLDIYVSDDLWEPAIEEVNDVPTEFDYKSYMINEYKELTFPCNECEYIIGSGKSDSGEIFTIGVPCDNVNYNISFKTLIDEFNKSYESEYFKLDYDFIDICMTNSYKWIILERNDDTYSSGEFGVLMHKICSLLSKPIKTTKRIAKSNEKESDKNNDLNDFKSVPLYESRLKTLFGPRRFINKYGVKIFVGLLDNTPSKFTQCIFVPTKYKFINKLNRFISEFNEFTGGNFDLTIDDFYREYVTHENNDVFMLHMKVPADEWAETDTFMCELAKYFQRSTILEEKENE